LNLGWPVIGIKYEEVTTAPEMELRKLAKLLSVEWEPSLLHHNLLSHSEIDEAGKAIGNTDPNRAIDRRSIGQWRNRLHQTAVDSILSVAGDLNSAFYPT
jgi:hypothetical protein